MTEAATRRRSRVTKHPDVRREELLDVALDLCRSHGFEAMNVEQVTRAAGVAKGTFYHYFASKDAMLKELVLRFGEGLFDHLNAATAGAGGTAVERIGAVMDAAAAYKLSQADLPYASFLYAEGNLEFRHRLFQTWREQARQVLAPIITAGNGDGTMRVADPVTATDVILLLWFEAADTLWRRALDAGDEDGFVQVMLAGAVAIYQAQARVLGIPEETFAVPLGPPVPDLTRQLYRSLKENR